MGAVLARFLARQLGKPSGLFGRLFLAPLWNRRNRALNDAVLERLAVQPGDRVLDVGFGGGYLLGRLATERAASFLAGVDISAVMVARGAQRYRRLVQAGRMDLRCAAAEALPYPAGHFTKVCSVNSIFYWHDARAALAECYRTLETGGQLVLCFTSRQSLTPRRFAAHGLTLPEPPDVQAALESCGFRTVRTARGADRHRTYYCTTAQK